MGKVFISICIPAYKRTNFLNRLLQSIETQTYKDFEVIISDDSDDSSVLQLIQRFSDKFPIHYYKNEKALGTPANWNFSISKATGEWIKLMHDDDWFASEKSLQLFADKIEVNNKFIFSAYANCVENTKQKQEIFISNIARQRILKAPVTLLEQNVVGPPSVTMVHRSITEVYDERMKWRVDLDFYIRILMQEKAYSYIDEVLVNVGVSETQVTNYCINIPSVELPEGYLLLEKFGTTPLKNIRVYDAWWRILRNNNIRSKEQLSQYVKEKKWPSVIYNMLWLQTKTSPNFLNNGVVSKTLMLLSYITNYKSL